MGNTHRACGFCGQEGAKISKEHAWPHWVRTLFPPGRTTILGHRSRHDVPGSITYFTEDMGVTINDFCDAHCNNGWMSRLESKAKPLLAPMIREGARTVLTHDDRVLLAKWATKTAMVFEFSSKERMFYSADHRRQMAAEQTIPASTRIHLLRYVGTFMSTARGTQITYEAEVGGATIPIEALSTTITLGQLVLQVLSASVPQGIAGLQIPFSASWLPLVLPCWPSEPAQDVIWPPSGSIDNDGLEKLLHAPAGRALDGV